MFRNTILILLTIVIFSNCNYIKQSSEIEETKKPISKENGEIYKEEMPDKKGSIIEIPKIAKLSVEEVENQFGPMEREWSVGSVGKARSYSINKGEAEMMLIYDEKGIKDIHLTLTTPRDTPEDILKAGGFELSDSKVDWENARVKVYKNRNFNGVRFREINVGNTNNGKWDDIRVDITR